MRLWNRVLVLLLLVSSLAVVGCSLFGDDDDDNNYSGPLTGSIKLAAEVDGGNNTFTAALRENIAGELRAATVSASDFKARVKIGAVTRLFTVVPKVVNNVANKLELKDAVVDSLTPGKLQVTIEIVASSSTETTGEAILKTIQTATVAAGQTNEDLVKTPAPVTIETTAKAIAYESWTGKDSKSIDDFSESLSTTDLANIVTAIKTDVEKAISAPTTTVLSDSSKQGVTDVVKVIPVVDTTPDLIKAAVKTYVENSIKMFAGTITSAERTTLGNVMADDFISSGFSKADYVAETGNETGLTLVGYTPTLTKISDTEYKVDVILTVSQDGKTETLNSATDGLVFDGTKFSASSLAPNMDDFPTLVRKQTDGSWKIAGNRSKLGWFGFHIDFRNVGNVGSQLHVNVEDGKSYKIKSGYVTGGLISGSVDLGKDNSSGALWNFWDGSKTSSYPLNFVMWDSSVVHAGKTYTMVVTFADDTTQTFEVTVPTLPTGIAAPANNEVKVSVVNGKVVVTYPRNALSGFESYEINIFSGNNSQAQFRIEDENTTSYEFAPEGTDSRGRSYSLTIGSEYYIGVSAFVGKGHFSRGSGSTVRLQETTPPVSSQRFSGNYRVFQYNASTKNRWSGMSEITVTNGRVDYQVKMDPDQNSVNSTGFFNVVESNGNLTANMNSTNRGAVSPSGDIAMMHDWKADDPMVSIFVKKPTSASNATLNGTYHMYEVGEDVGANYVPEKPKVQAYTMSFDGNGNCSATKGFDPDAMWDGAVSTTDRYSVTVDGKVTFDRASGMTGFIQVSPDGNVIVSAAFTTDNVIMTVGIKQDGALTTADMNGNWVYAGVNAGPGTPYSFTDGQLVSFNNGAGTWTGGVSDVSSEVQPDTTLNMTIGGNGTLNIGAADTYGSLSPVKDLAVVVSRGTGNQSAMRYFSLLVKK